LPTGEGFGRVFGKNKKYLADDEHRPHIGFRAINSDQEAIADIVNVPESVSSPRHL
jgi:hypothetical protein